MHRCRADRFWGLVYCIVIFAIFVWPAHGEPATQGKVEDLISVGVVDDIKILGQMIGQETSIYPRPDVAILPSPEFSRQLHRAVEENEIQAGDYAGFFSCKRNIIFIDSTKYKELATEFGISVDKYFRLVRFHELGHWVICHKLVSAGEKWVLMTERRFLIEQLGVARVTDKDRKIPPPPPQAKLKFPQDELLGHLHHWGVVLERLIQAATEDGTKIFVYVFRANVLKGGIRFTYELVSHQGEFISILVSRNEIPARLWVDKGYVGPRIRESVFAAHPVYVGDWVLVE